MDSFIKRVYCKIIKIKYFVTFSILSVPAFMKKNDFLRPNVILHLVKYRNRKERSDRYNKI